MKQVFNASGYLAEVRTNAGNTLYWKANTLTAEGRVSAEALGNGIVTNYGYDPASGRLTRRCRT